MGPGEKVSSFQARFLLSDDALKLVRMERTWNELSEFYDSGLKMRATKEGGNYSRVSVVFYVEQVVGHGLECKFVEEGWHGIEAPV